MQKGLKNKGEQAWKEKCREAPKTLRRTVLAFRGSILRQRLQRQLFRQRARHSVRLPSRRPLESRTFLTSPLPWPPASRFCKRGKRPCFYRNPSEKLHLKKTAENDDSPVSF